MQLNIEGIQATFLKAWDRETAWNGEWDPAFPACNQSAGTALVVWHLFGGFIRAGTITAKEIVVPVRHYWNCVKMKSYDFVASQLHDVSLKSHATDIGKHMSVAMYLLSEPYMAFRYRRLLTRFQTFRCFTSSHVSSPDQNRLDTVNGCEIEW